MASTPYQDSRSPLQLLSYAPKDHEKAIKQAFYNTAANIFVLFACAAAVAVYFILEAFLRPLLWAVLCGAFLNPFKSFLTKALRRWLNGLNDSGTPLLLSLVITPVKFVDSTAELICFQIWDHIRLLIGMCIGVPLLYLLWHFGPLWSIVGAVQAVFFFLYDLLGYFHSPWIWTLAIGYVIILIFFWTDESRVYLRYLSLAVWLVLVLHVAAAAGFLRVPLLILMIVAAVVGFVSERNEALRQRQEGAEQSQRQSMFDAPLSWLMGSTEDQTTEDTEHPGQSSQQEVKQSGLSDVPEVENVGTKIPVLQPVAQDMSKSDVTKPTSLNVLSGVQRRLRPPRSKLLTTPPQSEASQKSLSDRCFIFLLWAIVLTRIWMHFWLISVLLPIPIALFLFKKLGYKLSSPDGPLGDRVMTVRRGVAEWIRNRKEVLLPRWLRGVARLVMKGDQKIVTLLELSLDKATSVLFILLLLVGSAVFSVVFAIQVQQESMYVVKTTSNLLNNTLHPEMASWLPKNEDLQQAMDSMVSNAYIYGRNYIASKVRDIVDGSADKGKNSEMEKQVLEMWDRLYESWLTRSYLYDPSKQNPNVDSSKRQRDWVSLNKLHQLNTTSTNRTIPLVGVEKNESATSTSLTVPRDSQLTPFDMSNLTSMWDVVSKGSGFKLGDIYSFVKENIGTLVSVLESVWLVLKGNMSLVLSVLTSTLSVVFGGGTALLNFVISAAIFLTTLFYLLASSGETYKPIEWFASMSPGTGGNTFGQAVQDAVGGVFMASLKMASFYGLYTWLTHTLFGVNIVYIPSALAAVFAAVPFLGTYLAAIPAVLELWLVQDKFVAAVLLFVCHFLPSYVVDTAIYSEIKGGHPYVTGLAIAGGMYWIGLEGAIFGPIILCCLIVLVNVYRTMIRPGSPSFLRRNSENSLRVSSKSYKRSQSVI